MKRRAPKTGSIYQRKSDKRFVAAYTDADGEQRVLYAKTRQGAQERLSAALALLERGMAVPNKQQTVEQYLVHWLDGVKSSVKPRTYRSYHDSCHLHIIPALGKIKLHQLRPMAVSGWINGPAMDGLSPRTVRYLHTVLKIALNQAEAWEMVANNAAQHVKPPRVPGHEIVALDEQQARTLQNAAVGEANEALYMVAVTMGCRRGEILALRWQDIDLDKKTLRVRHTLQRQDGKPVLSEPKSERSRRVLTMPEMLIGKLKQHRREMMALGRGWKPDDFVFSSRCGEPLDAGNLNREYKKLLKKAGLPDVTFHSLRHTAASMLMEQGVDPLTVMYFLGHSNPNVTLSIYCHVSSKQKRGAAEKIDAVYS